MYLFITSLRLWICFSVHVCGIRVSRLFFVKGICPAIYQIYSSPPLSDNFFNENLLDTLTLNILLQEGIFLIIV